MTSSPPPVRDGRSLAWRLGTLAAAALFGGIASALVWRPELLSYAVAVGFAALAVGCAISALAARGR